MSLKTKTLKFKGNSITFLFHQAFGWCAPAKLIGLALGYANEGQKLNDLITTSWSKKGWKDSDSKVFAGKELKELKEETPEYGVSLEANSVLFLSMSGVIKVLMRSRSKTADEFRSFISSKGGELTEGLSIPKKSVIKAGLKKPVIQENDIPGHLRTRLALLGELKKYGATDEKIQGLLMDIYTQETNRQNTSAALSTIASMVPAKKDATQMVPVSNIQASSLTPNFDTIRSFFLTGHQKHPKYADWIPAEEIGAPFGLTSDQARTFTTEYAKQRVQEIANVTAMKKVKDAGGYFRGVSTLVDESGLPTYVNETLGCAGIWYLMEDGKLVWRNYWSPAAVTDIVKLIPESKKVLKKNGPQDPNYLPPGMNFGETVEGQAVETPVKQ